MYNSESFDIKYYCRHCERLITHRPVFKYDFSIHEGNGDYHWHFCSKECVDLFKKKWYLKEK